MMKNINELNVIRTINVEAPMADVEVGSGTVKELVDAVYAGEILPLVNNNGDILGISYNRQTTDSVSDNIEQMKFMRRYYGIDVQECIMQILDLMARRLNVVEVKEDDYAAELTLESGETVVVTKREQDVEEEDEDWDDEEYDEDTRREWGIPEYWNADDDWEVESEREILPYSVYLTYEGIGMSRNEAEEQPSKALRAIKKALREKYGYYLSGNADDGELVINHADHELRVSNISWGRKMSSTER